MSYFRNLLVLTVAGSALSLGVLGCQADHPDLVPTGATLMQSGNGMMHYTAPDDGIAYVYDHQTNKLLWSGAISKGRAVDVDPQKGQISVDGRIAANNTLSPTDRTDLYFMQQPTMTPPPMVAAPAPVAPPAAPQPAPSPNLNGGFTVTPSVSVQQNSPQGSVTVQPGLSVAPATQPSGAPTTAPSQP